MRNDLVEKYQHYMTEAARLQELVETQNRYIEDLESAIIEIISEENKAMLDCIRSCPDMDVDDRQACKERCWKEHSVKEQHEDDAQNQLSAADRVMADIMPGVKAKNRPMMKPKKPVDLSAEALRLKAQEDLEK